MKGKGIFIFPWNLKAINTSEKVIFNIPYIGYSNANCLHLIGINVIHCRCNDFELFYW